MVLREMIEASHDVLREQLARLRAITASMATPSRPGFDLAQLEDRILMSATPMPVDLAMADLSLDLPADQYQAPAPAETTVSAHDFVFTAEPPPDVADCNPTLDSLRDPTSQTPVLLTEESSIDSLRRELVFVDTGVADYDQLLSGLLSNADENRQMDVVLLDADHDGIQQISDGLASYTDLDAVHLISHGMEGQVKMGNKWLSIDNLDQYAPEIARWSNSLLDGGDLLLYGCDLASTQAGRALTQALGALCECDVAASVDDTGHARFAGNWELEYTTGNIESDVALSAALQEGWIGKLATITVTTTSDVVDGGERHAGLRYGQRGQCQRVTSPVDTTNEDTSDVNGDGQRINETTFDDDKSQSAARFLMRLDEALQFQQAEIHEASLYALNAFVKAQFPNGAWPQRYATFPDPQAHPVRKASFPRTWSRTHPKRDYRNDYTLNDNTIGDVITTMLDGWEVYAEPRYLAAARRGGDFLLLAQLPDSQPGWAQQYDFNMQPAWARRFEPPAITGGESQGVMRTLIGLYRRTGERKYLDPLPRAIAYYRQNLLPNGQLARFYEIGTNKPLYFTKDYRLTYSDADLPTHYSFKVNSSLDAIEAEHRRLAAGTAERESTAQESPHLSSLGKRARAVIDGLDERGAWVEAGRMRYQGDGDSTTRVIESRTFCENLLVLARFIAAESN